MPINSVLFVDISLIHICRHLQGDLFEWNELNGEND